MRIKFKRNMGNLDRAIRAAVGLTLFTVGPVTNIITPDELSNTLLSMVGTLALVSALISYCILYDITGFGTGKESGQSR